MTKDNLWFTADTHFGHKNIMNYASRYFKDIDKHDAFIIKKWNEFVKKDDIVYHLGDFSFHNTEKTIEIIKSLNGKIHLILGGHDKNMSGAVKKLFESVSSYKELDIDDEEIGKVCIVLFHYPIEEWNKKHYGAWHLHGHCHTKLNSKRNETLLARLDVGIDNNNNYPMIQELEPEYIPFSYQRIKEIFSQRLLTQMQQ